MKKLILLPFFSFMLLGLLNAQDLKFFPSNPKLFKSNNTMDFMGGLQSVFTQPCDLNYDGEKDLIVYDFLGRKTLTFLNINKQYQYAPQFEKSLNFIEGWFFVRDYNRDGLDDFFIENFGNISVYKNISKGNTLKFKMQNEILTDTTDLLPGLKANIYADQSAVPAFEDIDKDGDIDIIAQNILSKSFDLYINVQVEGHLPKDSMALIWVDDSWGGSLIDSIFSNIYNNREESNICLFDEDGDEDLDLLVSTDGKNAPFILYNLRKDLNLNVDSFNSYTPHFPLNDTSLMYNPSIAYFDLDLDGIKDLVISSIRRYSMVEQQAILLLNKKNGKFNLSSANYFEDKILDLGSYSAPAFFDFDLDGDKDLVVGITKDYLGTLYLYQNTGTELLPEYKLIDTNWLELSQYNRSPIPAFGDLNNDGLEDLLVGTYKENLIYFKNNGQKLILESLFFDSINVGNSSSPTIADVNYDGLNDLIIGCENGNLFYYENNGKAKGKRFGLVSDSLGKIFTNEISYVGNTPHDTSDIGRSVPCAVDIDKNGTLDLVVGGITGSIKVYKNISNYIHSKARVSENIYFDHSIDTFGLADFGTYTCTAVCNLDGDTMPDIMVGNSRGGFNLMGTKRTTSIVTNNSVYLPSQSAQTSVFPNPTKNELNISVKYTNDNYAYTIVNLLGEEVMKGIVNQNKTTLNIENLPTGMYILKLVNKTEESTIKFVKE